MRGPGRSTRSFPRSPWRDRVRRPGNAGTVPAAPAAAVPAAANPAAAPAKRRGIRSQVAGPGWGEPPGRWWGRGPGHWALSSASWPSANPRSAPRRARPQTARSSPGCLSAPAWATPTRTPSSDRRNRASSPRRTYWNMSRAAGRVGKPRTDEVLHRDRRHRLLPGFVRRMQIPHLASKTARFVAVRVPVYPECPCESSEIISTAQLGPGRSGQGSKVFERASALRCPSA